MSDTIAECVRAGRPLWDACPIVDMHGHAGPYFQFRVPDNDPAAMIRTMDRLGMQCLLVAPHIAIGCDSEAGNQLALEMLRQYPGRFYGYAVPYPHEPRKSRAMLERALDAGCVAIKLHPSAHHYRITDPGYKIAFDVARERGTFILSHTWLNDPMCSQAMIEQLAQEYPEVPFILGHSGGSPAAFPSFVALAQRYPNLYLDTTCSYAEGRWVRRMVAEAGVERIIYGSDLPFIDPRYGLGKVALSGLTDAELTMVLRENGARLLRAAGVTIS